MASLTLKVVRFHRPTPTIVCPSHRPLQLGPVWDAFQATDPIGLCAFRSAVSVLKSGSSADRHLQLLVKHLGQEFLVEWSVGSYLHVLGRLRPAAAAPATPPAGLCGGPTLPPVKAAASAPAPPRPLLAAGDEQPDSEGGGAEKEASPASACPSPARAFCAERDGLAFLDELLSGAADSCGDDDDGGGPSCDPGRLGPGARGAAAALPPAADDFCFLWGPPEEGAVTAATGFRDLPGIIAYEAFGMTQEAARALRALLNLAARGGDARRFESLLALIGESRRLDAERAERLRRWEAEAREEAARGALLAGAPAGGPPARVPKRPRSARRRRAAAAPPQQQRPAKRPKAQLPPPPLRLTEAPRAACVAPGEASPFMREKECVEAAQFVESVVPVEEECTATTVVDDTRLLLPLPRSASFAFATPPPSLHHHSTIPPFTAPLHQAPHPSTPPAPPPPPPIPPPPPPLHFFTPAIPAAAIAPLGFPPGSWQRQGASRA